MLDLVAQSILSGIDVGAIYGLIGIGFCVVYNASGIVNFAQGAFVMLGGMLTYAAMYKFGLPFPLAAIVAIGLVAMVGVFPRSARLARPAATLRGRIAVCPAGPGRREWWVSGRRPACCAGR